jgi:transcriptional regulator with GAF, ATPase, and Fis domain
MRLRRFTAHATDLFKLIPGDIGRALSDISTDLDYLQLRNDAQEVLRTLIFCEQQVATHDGRWYRVRIMPYRTLENMIDGVVITFIDISDIKKAEVALLDSKARLASEANALNRLTDASARLWRKRDQQQGLDEILTACLELLGTDKGNVQILEAGAEVLHIAAQQGFEQEFLDVFREVSAAHETACGRALRQGQRIVIEDVESDEAFTPYRDIASRSGFRSVVSAPLVGHDGKGLGVLSAHFSTPHRPSNHELQLLDLFARQAAGFIERIRMEEALRDSERRLSIAEKQLTLAPGN